MFSNYLLVSKTNIKQKETHKKRQYENSLIELASSYVHVKNMNLSMGTIGTIGINSKKALVNLLERLSARKQATLLGTDPLQILHMCKRDFLWSRPELLTF